ncbi:MAG: PQQ-dependent sugar dehydrogenase, partial [Anaerolineales bacterium]|nr:PQQ-dependent sugar dehydrogenase [Anaerolineales bacterium]
MRIRHFGILLLASLVLAACGEAAPAATPIVNTAVPPPTTTLEPPPTASPNPTSTRETVALETAVPPTAQSPTETPTSPPAASATATTAPTTAEPLPTPVAIIELAGATVPPGFSFIKFADLYRPTSLSFDNAGRLYTTSFDGTVHILSDEDGDGRSDNDTVFANGFSTALGITLRPGSSDVYVSSNGQITLLRDENGDDRADVRQQVVSGLPTGLHQNDNLKFGPDGLLYIGIGSTCDACVETDPRSATIMRFDINTKQGEVFATGMRNPYDLAFHPVTGDLFATDNGRDDLGMDAPQEELNHIVQGGDYGWPDCWDEGVGSGCAGTKTAVAFFESHSSADSLTFYTGNRFPADYQHNAFVSILGSWLKSGVKTGVARVILTPDGDGYRSE